MIYGRLKEPLFRGSNKIVSLEVIDKICKELEVQPGDIMEFISEEM